VKMAVKIFVCEYLCMCVCNKVYGSESVKPVLPPQYQAMVMPGQYPYMACILLIFIFTVT